MREKMGVGTHRFGPSNYKPPKREGETVAEQAKRMKLSLSKVRKLRQGTYTLTQEERRISQGGA